MAHKHHRDILVPEKEGTEIRTHPILQKGSQLPLGNGKLQGNGIFSTIEKKIHINMDSVFLAAVS